MVRHSCFHRWRNSQRLVNATKVVVHNIKRHAATGKFPATRQGGGRATALQRFLAEWGAWWIEGEILRCAQNDGRFRRRREGCALNAKSPTLRKLREG